MEKETPRRLAMSNSSLVNYTKISPNKNSPRKDKIRKITIHHMAGNLSVETCGNVFASSSRQASANYGIGSDGRVGMYVEEKDRSWCSASAENDHQAITIEVANDVIGGNWHVSDKAFNKLIDLCVDICQRNGISKLNWTGDTTGNLTIHKMFVATTCPGPYLESKMPEIAEKVNARLGESDKEEEEETVTPAKNIKVGDIVTFLGGSHYSSANATSAASTTLKAGPAKVTSISSSSKHPYHLIHTDSQSKVYGWVDKTSIKEATSNETETTEEPTSKVISVGDIVNFAGGKVYSSTGASSAAATAKAGPAKVTIISNGKHPYHIIHTNSQSTVYGWVDASTIGAESSNSSTPAKEKNPYAEPTKTVRFAEWSEGVKWIQWELNEAGYDLDVDGKFGSGTLAAVKDFQKKNGLEVDGLVGSATIAKLKAL